MTIQNETDIKNTKAEFSTKTINLLKCLIQLHNKQHNNGFPLTIAAKYLFGDENYAPMVSFIAKKYLSDDIVIQKGPCGGLISKTIMKQYMKPIVRVNQFEQINIIALQYLEDTFKTNNVITVKQLVSYMADKGIQNFTSDHVRALVKRNKNRFDVEKGKGIVLRSRVREAESTVRLVRAA